MGKGINWHSDKLTVHTVITESYKTTQNVRRFFKGETGNEVRFNREFREWMHRAIGKTLGHAIEEFRTRNK
jgi:hypothetical protein